MFLDHIVSYNFGLHLQLSILILIWGDCLYLFLFGILDDFLGSSVMVGGMRSSLVIDGPFII